MFQEAFYAHGIGTRLRLDAFLTTTAKAEQLFSRAQEYFDLAFAVIISLCPRLVTIDLDSYKFDLFE